MPGDELTVLVNEGGRIEIRGPGEFASVVASWPLEVRIFHPQVAASATAQQQAIREISVMLERCSGPGFCRRTSKPVPRTGARRSVADPTAEPAPMEADDAPVARQVAAPHAAPSTSD